MQIFLHENTLVIGTKLNKTSWKLLKVHKNKRKLLNPNKNKRNIKLPKHKLKEKFQTC